MFCVHCGRRLPENGYCVCGALQPGQVPMQQPVVVPAPETTGEMQFEVMPEPVIVSEPVIAVEPQPEIIPEPVVVVEPESESIPEPIVEAQLEPVWEDIRTQSQPKAPVQSYDAYRQPAYNNSYSPKQPDYVPPVYQQPVYQAPSYAVQNESTPAQAVLRSVAGSPLFMIAAVVLSVQLLVSVISSFIPVNILSLVNTYVPMLESFIPGITYEVNEAIMEILPQLAAIQATIGLSMLPAKILPALTVAALWMLFVSAKKKTVPSSAGLTILQVIQILALIGAGLGILGVLIIGIFIIVIVALLMEEVSYYGMAGDAAGLTSVVVVVAVIVIIALLAGVVLNLIYNIKLLTTVVGAKKVIKNGKAEKAASMFVVVWNFLCAAGLALDLFGNFVLLGWTTGVANLCTAVGYVLFALCILKYNKGIKPVLADANLAAAPAVQQPPYPPYGA